jgi:hypothetical protein
MVNKMRIQAAKREKRLVTKAKTNQIAKLMLGLLTKPVRSISKPSKPDEIYVKEQ